METKHICRHKMVLRGNVRESEIVANSIQYSATTNPITVSEIKSATVRRKLILISIS